MPPSPPTCKHPLRIFISGPYRDPDPIRVGDNIRAAREAKAALMRRGHYTFCPHSESAWFQRDFPDIPDEAHLDNCLAWLEFADAIFMLPGWEQSEGAMLEYGYASTRGRTIYTDIEEVPVVEGTVREASDDKN